MSRIDAAWMGLSAGIENFGEKVFSTFCRDLLYVKLKKSGYGFISRYPTYKVLDYAVESDAVEKARVRMEALHDKPIVIFDEETKNICLENGISLDGENIIFA